MCITMSLTSFAGHKENWNFKEQKDIKVIVQCVPYYYKNIDGTFYKDTDNMVEILSKHIVSPVRFDKAIKLMKDENVNTFVEIGPGKALTGFIRKELSDVNTINIYDVETLEKAIQELSPNIGGRENGR